MKCGLDNYKFGNKNNWRRWQWNRIIDKLTNKPSESIVIYLSGPKDIDREIALSKGFKNNNLIAVDYNRKNISKIRSDGKLGVIGELGNIISNWGKSQQIDVIIADFCCGYNEQILDFAKIVINAQSLKETTIISINLLRGREKYKNIDKRDLFKEEIKEEKHRGKLFYNYMKIYWLICVESCFGEKDIDITKVEERLKLIDIYWGEPYFNSYKSENKKTIMDSAIISFIRLGWERYFDRDNRIKRQIAAIKAHRTMRIEDH